MSRITIARNAPADVKHRQLILTLDDEHVATLLYGETFTKAIDPGHHRLKVDNTFVWKTVEFDVAPEGEVNFRVISRAGRFTWWMVALLGAGPMYVTIEQTPSPKP